MITSTSFHCATAPRPTQWEAAASSHPRRRQRVLPEALTYRGESDLVFSQATGFIPDTRDFKRD